MSIHDYRLTHDDEERIRVALVEWYDSHRTELRKVGASPRAITAIERVSLRRVLFHSIGCSEADLREVEIAWIDSLVEHQEVRVP